ncbi:hypothetical protein ACOMHN_058420 [Nucella lapillus]
MVLAGQSSAVVSLGGQSSGGVRQLSAVSRLEGADNSRRSVVWRGQTTLGGQSSGGGRQLSAIAQDSTGENIWPVKSLLLRMSVT